jgi:hypothetical protein
MEGEMKEEKSVLERNVDRRQFTLASAMAILSGVVITITDAACGGSSGSPTSPTPTPTPAPNPTPTPAASGDKVGQISANHGHRAVITAAQLTGGGAISLDIRGDATHTHTVDLSAADMAAIAASQKVSKQSSRDDAHAHTVTFN